MPFTWATSIEKAKAWVDKMRYSMLLIVVHTGIKTVVRYAHHCSSIRPYRKQMGTYIVSKRGVRSSAGTNSEATCSGLRFVQVIRR